MRLPRDGRWVDSGFLFLDQAALRDLLCGAWREGWAVTVHAIGNRAVDEGLAGIAAALREEPQGRGRVRRHVPLGVLSERG